MTKNKTKQKGKSIEEVHERWLKKKLENLYGKRCPDYEVGCGCCQAWSVYDSIIDENRGRL